MACTVQGVSLSVKVKTPYKKDEYLAHERAQPTIARFTYRRAAFFNTLQSKAGLMTRGLRLLSAASASHFRLPALGVGAGNEHHTSDANMLLCTNTRILCLTLKLQSFFVRTRCLVRTKLIRVYGS